MKHHEAPRFLRRKLIAAVLLFLAPAFSAVAAPASATRGGMLIELVRTHAEIEEKESRGLTQQQGVKDLQKKRLNLVCRLILIGGPSQGSGTLRPIEDIPSLLISPDTAKALLLEEAHSIDFQQLVLANRAAPKTSDGAQPIGESELVNARQYAAFIQNTAGEKLLLLPSYQGRSVAGFDGVIYNSEMQPVANYSAKSADNPSNLEFFIDEAIAKGNRYSNVHAWVPWHPNTPYLSVLHPKNKPGTTSKDRSKQVAQAFVHSMTWLKDLWSYLGIQVLDNGQFTPLRPYRIVVDIGDHNAVRKQLPSLLKMIQGKIKANPGPGRVDSVILLVDGKAIVIDPQNTREVPFPR